MAGDERPLRPVGPEEGILPPSFDIVRIEPTGQGAASGRAPADAKVMLRADGRTVAGTDADDRGEWALLISPPLPAGDHALSLLAALSDGRGLASSESIIVSIPEQPVARPLVVLMAPGRVSEVMQNPSGFSPRSLSLDAVDQDGRGGLRIGGRAEPETSLNLYLDNQYLGSATADGEGRWALRLDRRSLKPGSHRFRLDALAADEFGARRVSARLDVAFESKPPVKAKEPLTVESDAQAWRILSESGASTVVYGITAARPLDPRTAYPGQVAGPAPAATAAMPAADR